MRIKEKASTPTSEAASLGEENWGELPRSCCWCGLQLSAWEQHQVTAAGVVTSVTCHVSRGCSSVTTVVLMLSRAWSGVRAARREAAERAVARASPASPASPAQPSPAQPSPAPHLELEPETWTREAVVAATAALHQ